MDAYHSDYWRSKEGIDSYNETIDKLEQDFGKENSLHILKGLCDPEKAEEMGQNGRQTILTKYNWLNEEKVLFNFYQEIIFNNRKEFCF